FPALQILLPSLRGAKLYYSTMIGLNLWQSRSTAAAAAALSASQITRTKVFCPVAAANAAPDEADFGTCRPAGSVRYLFRATHESRRSPDIMSKFVIGNVLARRARRLRETPENIVAQALISNHVR